MKVIKSSLIIALSCVSVACMAKDNQLMSESADQAKLSPAVANGKAVFMKHCAECHSYNYGTDGVRRAPAVNALDLKYKGAVSPYLEERVGLSFEVLKVFVRQGYSSMPPFRKTEFTDADLRDVAEYLAHTSNLAQAKNKDN